MPDQGGIDTLRVGEIRIDALLDADLQLPVARLWADGTPPFPLDEADERYPAEFEGGSWHFVVRVFLLRGPHGTVLVDAGMGSAEVPMGREFDRPGRLLELLGELGVAPESVEHLVLTHRHDDHVGWSPAFVNAEVHLGAADAAAAAAIEGEYRDRVFAPLAASGRLRPVIESHALMPGITIVPSPGHTPGHLHVLVEHDDQVVAIVGDLVHLAFQVTDRAAPGPFDAEPGPAAAARERVLAALPDGALLASAHLPAPFTRLTGSTDEQEEQH